MQTDCDEVVCKSSGEKCCLLSIRWTHKASIHDDRHVVQLWKPFKSQTTDINIKKYINIKTVVQNAFAFTILQKEKKINCILTLLFTSADNP